jgi:hypothetical protein
MPTHTATATLTAATHSNGQGVAVLVLIGLVWAAGYLLLCWIWPFRYCRRCRGWGKRHAPIGRGFRHCPRCDGTGYRLRIGRHVINHLRRTHHRANR